MAMSTGKKAHAFWFTKRLTLLAFILVLVQGCGGRETAEEEGATTEAAGPEAGSAAGGAAGPPITELSALVASPGAALLDGREVSLVGVRVESTVSDSAFFIGSSAGGNQAVEPGGRAPVEAEGDTAGAMQDTLGAAPSPGQPGSATPGDTGAAAPIAGEGAQGRILVVLNPTLVPEPAVPQGTATDTTQGMEVDTMQTLTEDDPQLTEGDTTWVLLQQGDIINLHGWVDVADVEELQQYGLTAQELGTDEDEIVYILADRVIPPAP